MAEWMGEQLAPKLFYQAFDNYKSRIAWDWCADMSLAAVNLVLVVLCFSHLRLAAGTAEWLLRSSSKGKSSNNYLSRANEATISPTNIDLHIVPQSSTHILDSQSRLLSFTHRDLFDGYDKRIRPVRNRSSTVLITSTMTLYQLLQVHEEEEFVAINVWMSQMWYDEYLAWDPAEYDGIGYLVVPWDHVWMSDIVLYNSLDMNDISSEKRINVELVMNDNVSRAQVRFAFPAIYRFSCKMDMYYFPFDSQNCTMIFGSWIYDTGHVDLRPHGSRVKIDNFIENQEWKLQSFNAYRHVFNYSCCPRPYVNVQYHLVIQRRPLFFCCSYVVPTHIVALISIIGSFTPGSTGFEREEKVSLGISTLLAMSILLLMVSDKMPTAGSYIPLMAQFFLVIIVLVAAAISMTTLVISIQRYGRFGARMGTLSRYILVHTLAPLLFLDTYAAAKRKRQRSEKTSFCHSQSSSSFYFTNSYKDLNGSQSPLINGGGHPEINPAKLGRNRSLADRATRDSLRLANRSKPGVHRHNTNHSIKSTAAPPIGNSGHQFSSLQHIQDNIITDEQRALLYASEWEAAADVIERVLLIIFIALLFATTLVFLLPALRHYHQTAAAL